MNQHITAPARGRATPSPRRATIKAVWFYRRPRLLTPHHSYASRSIQPASPGPPSALQDMLPQQRQQSTQRWSINATLAHFLITCIMRAECNLEKDFVVLRLNSEAHVCLDSLKKLNFPALVF